MISLPQPYESLDHPADAGVRVHGQTEAVTMEGSVSPGGVGYDINCGVRVIATELDASDHVRHMDRLVSALFRRVPTGVGASKDIEKLDDAELRRLLSQDARWGTERGYRAGDDDVERTEERSRRR